MKRNNFCHRCPIHSISRRNFIYSSAAVGVGLLLNEFSSFSAEKPKRKLRIIYSIHSPKQQGPDWPNKGFNFEPVMEKTNQELAKKFKHFEFLYSTANGPEQADKIIEQDKLQNIDGYIVFQMNCWNRVVQSVAKTGKPVLYVDFKYGGSGGFLTYTATFIRENAKNVGFLSSSRSSDLIEAVKCFERIESQSDVIKFADYIAEIRRQNTPKASRLSFKTDALDTISLDDWVKQIKESRILAVRGQQSGPAGEMMGMKVIHVPFAEINEAWKNADKEKSRAVAMQWRKNAAKVEDVNDEVLLQSAAMYVAQKDVMKKYGAVAITINCLGGFYGGHIHAYPCLGFHQLLNEGLVGGCECDVRSAAVMTAFGMLTKGRPGFISDPVIDTSKRQIIYAHCVASNYPFGPKEKPYPYQILTHSEDRQGASVRAILPTGYLTTTLEIHPDKKEILLHQAKAVGNDPDDRACRTKLVGEPLGDIEKLFTMWDQWGWHRVTFYGDLKKHAYALADAMGWKVVEEA
ncbi:MAG: hypothetical protein N2487_01265 [Verrucomicrobiae bacterium]|nr:hypothetical protein [Verrucomicrobiae bacterium]